MSIDIDHIDINVVNALALPNLTSTLWKFYSTFLATGHPDDWHISCSVERSN